MNDLKWVFLKDVLLSQDLISLFKSNRVEVDSYILFSNYYIEYYGEGFLDLSFAILQEDKLMAYALCHKINNKLCFSLEGVKIRFITENAVVAREMGRRLQAIAQEYACLEMMVYDQFQNEKLSPLGEYFFNQRYIASLQFCMRIGLHDFSEELFFRNLRKSYKSLVNWGKKNLEIEIIDVNNPNYEKFILFKMFHHKISGKITRSDKTWELQYEMIVKGFGELILAFYENRLVAGSLFIEQEEETVYFTGVYDRTLFEYGVSHYLVYLGIVRAAKKGKARYCSLGVFNFDIQDQKWYNIQFFKKGFCKDLQPVVVWKCTTIEACPKIPSSVERELNG